MSVAVLGASQPSYALLFDQNVTPEVIFGSGNANGSFTVDQSNGIELGLRGKLRHNASGAPENTFNSNGDGTYSFNAGVAPTQSSPTAEWSFEWSINTNYDGSSGTNLDDYIYVLGLDSDPGIGQSFLTFDPINVTNADHAIGDNFTGNGGGSVASDPTNYASLIASNNVAQNSWKPHWFLGTSGFDPTVDGQYDFFLEAFDGSTSLARTEMSIIVGTGASAPVPEPGILALLGLGLPVLVSVTIVGLRSRKASTNYFPI